MNPLGMVEALLGAMSHSAALHASSGSGAGSGAGAGAGLENKQAVDKFVETLRLALHNTFRYGQGTRDMAGPSGLTTEAFIDKVAWRLGRYVAKNVEEEAPPAEVEPALKFKANYDVDREALGQLFAKYDKNQVRRVAAAEAGLRLG